MGTTVKLTHVTLCYPHLYQRHVAPGAEPPGKWSAEFILDPQNPRHVDLANEIRNAFMRVAVDAGKQSHLGYLESPLKSGDEANQKRQARGKDPRPELAGKLFIRAASATEAPYVVDRRVQPLPEERAAIFGGCIVNANIDLYWSGNALNPGVYCGLNGVQLIDNVNVTRIGGGRQSADAMFAEEEGNVEYGNQPPQQGHQPMPEPVGFNLAHSSYQPPPQGYQPGKADDDIPW